MHERIERRVQGTCQRILGLIDQGGTPGLRTDGTGTDSANCPLTGVGNLTGPGTYPLKYLDAFFDRVEIQSEAGNWIPIHAGEAVQVGKSAPVARPALRLPTSVRRHCFPRKMPPAKTGSVYVTACGAGEARTALPKDASSL